MTSPEPQPREIPPPVRFMHPGERSTMTDRDFSPYPVTPNDWHPGEATATADTQTGNSPKVTAANSSVQVSAELFSDLVPAPEDLSVPVEKGSPLPLDPETQVEFLSPDSPKATSPGDATQPVETQKSDQAPTPSSPSAGK